MPHAEVYFVPELSKQDGSERLVVSMLLLAPIVSLIANALAWLNYGIDLPYADDWRTYIDGTAYSLALKNLFTPANDTLFPVGRALDVLAMRWLAGNSVAYQFLSMIIVLGGLLYFQWRLLVCALNDRVLAASALSLTLFMLQPDSYWGLQNLAYHQAIPLLCILAALSIIIGPVRARFAIPSLLCLGLISGLSYISGAFAILTLAVVVLAFSIFLPDCRRSYAVSGSALLVAGIICAAAQIWVIVSAQKGHISGKVPWARPDEVEFWAYMLGKFGRSLLLPINAPRLSFCLTVSAIIVLIGITITFIGQLLRRSFRTQEQARTALIFVSLAAVVFVYMLLVAAGRAKLRPESITYILDIFSFGFLRFHFFWATLLWPWVAAVVLLWLVQRFADRRLALAGGFLLVLVTLPLAVWLGAFEHVASYKTHMVYRTENEVKCLESALQKDGSIVCPIMDGFGRDMRPVYDFALRHDASFTRYFSDIRSKPSSLRKWRLEDTPSLIDQVPVGELVQGASIVQTVALSAEERTLLQSGKSFCFKILLATYDRPSIGNAIVSLSLGNQKAHFKLAFPSVENNAYHTFCGSLSGQNAMFGLTNEKLVIRVDGLDGRTGSSITAWLTADTTRGTAFVDKADTGKSLLFSLSELSPYRIGGIFSYFLYIFFSVLIGHIVVKVAKTARSTVIAKNKYNYR